MSKCVCSVTEINFNHDQHFPVIALLSLVIAIILHKYLMIADFI